MGIQIYKGADTTLKFLNFKNVKTGAALTGKTVTVDIHEKVDDTKLGATVTLTDDADGDYYGNVADDHADLEVGMRVVCKLTADGGSNLKCYKEADGTVLTKRER